MTSESSLQRAILERVGSRRDVRLWRNNTGAAIPFATVKAAIDLLCAGKTHAALNVLRSATAIRFGLVGSSDLLGIVKPSGRLLAVEVKSATGKLSEPQENFLAMVRDFGGVPVEARSVEDVENRLANLEAER